VNVKQERVALIVAYLTSVVEQLSDAFAIEESSYENVGERHMVVDVRM
jgi:hypothetical protein